ncbi:hypothetical protein GCM10022286_28120 [Gryllotalpicola daejeonensis]|uniref:ABC transporter permease n=1 Tax=Gryllotalpicola daejeonensis TaxID=993087 RepID=A0ABP7ZMZ2_9MICO
MTAVSITELGTRVGGSRTPSAFARIWRIVRLHYANRVSTIIAPLGAAAAIFAVYLIVQAIVVHEVGPSAKHGEQYSTSLVYFLPYQVVFAVQAMNLTFPFALGMSSTRRDFSLGTWLVFVIQSAFFSVLFTVLSYLEQWTHGWGLGAQIFQTFIYGRGEVGQRLLTFFAGILLFQCIGSVFGAAFVRWRANGLMVLSCTVMVLALGAAVLITFTNSWAAVGRWFVSVGPSGFAAWLLLPAAVFAVIGHLALRRATPKS